MIVHNFCLRSIMKKWPGKLRKKLTRICLSSSAMFKSTKKERVNLRKQLLVGPEEAQHIIGRYPSWIQVSWKLSGKSPLRMGLNRFSPKPNIFKIVRTLVGPSSIFWKKHNK